MLVFIFGRAFDPVIFVDASKESALVILSLWGEDSLDLDGKISGKGFQKAMAVVPAKTVMCALPEIGFRLGLECEAIWCQ